MYLLSVVDNSDVKLVVEWVLHHNPDEANPSLSDVVQHLLGRQRGGRGQGKWPRPKY